MHHDDRATINRALRLIHEIGRTRGLDVVIHLKTDGRVMFDFENLAGYVKGTARADLAEGSVLPLPGDALAAFGGRSGGKEKP